MREVTAEELARIASKVEITDEDVLDLREILHKFEKEAERKSRERMITNEFLTRTYISPPLSKGVDNEITR